MTIVINNKGNRRKKIVWGVLLLMLAAGLIVLAFAPDVSWFSGVAVWKWFVGAVLAYWIINTLFFSHRLRDHFDFIFPLALLFMVFESDIARAAGLESDFVNNWLIFGIAVILEIALHLIFDNIGKTGFKKAEWHNQLGDNSIFFDVSEKTKFQASNRLGELNVYFQNSDVGGGSDDIQLDISNELGEVNIIVPDRWRIDNRINNSLGEVNEQRDESEKSRILTITGSNRLGEINIRYQDVGNA